jgi:hypothetical protein
VHWFSRAGFQVEGLLIADSLQYREPRRALRWIAREYASWMHSLAIAGWRWLRGRRSIDRA